MYFVFNFRLLRCVIYYANVFERGHGVGRGDKLR